MSPTARALMFVPLPIVIETGLIILNVLNNDLSAIMCLLAPESAIQLSRDVILTAVKAINPPPLVVVLTS